MLLDITEEEYQFLSELLEEKLRAMIHEINRTDARDYKELLKQRYDLVEAFRAKVENLRRPSPISYAPGFRMRAIPITVRAGHVSARELWSPFFAHIGPSWPLRCLELTCEKEARPCRVNATYRLTGPGPISPNRLES
jgi:hypothetical protein